MALINADELLKASWTRKLTAVEIVEVADALKNGSSGQDPYSLLLLLGRAGARQHAPLVERWLGMTSDPMLVRIALQVLCSMWGMTDTYLPWVKRLVRGESWDSDEDARLMAMSVAGTYLKTVKDPELLSMLLDVVETSTERELSRQSAYLALALAMGADDKDLPRLSKLPPLVDLIDNGVLERARAIVG
jgi:hypothetical protein